MKQPTYRCLLLAAGLASAALLGAVLVLQYGFDMHPCELCIAQRYPYLAVIVTALLGFFLTKSSKHARLLIFLCCLLFLLDGGIAFYHAGVEAGWFPGPSGCTNHASSGDSLEEMRRQIMNAPLVPCDQPMMHILGLSLAAWNAIAAFLLASVLACGLRKLRHEA